MHVAILLTKDTLRARYILECFEKGLAEHGDSAVWVSDLKNWRAQVEHTDLGVQVSYPNKHHGDSDVGHFRIDVNEHFYKRRKRIVTIDTGHILSQSEYELKVAADKGKHEVLFDLDRVETYQNVLRHVYYQVGYDGLKRNADYCVGDDAPGSRWRQLQKQGVELLPWRKRGEHILLVGQTVNGLSSQNTNIYEWYGDTIAAIRKITDRPIVFRHHPRISKIRGHGKSRVAKDVAALEKAIGRAKHFRRSDPAIYLLAKDLENAWAAVGFTSNASVTAPLLGVPIFTGHKSNMAWEVGNHDLKKIEEPRMPDRTIWLNKMAYSQWNCQEMLDGTCWAHLRPHALKPATPAYEWH